MAGSIAKAIVAVIVPLFLLIVVMRCVQHVENPYDIRFLARSKRSVWFSTESVVCNAIALPSLRLCIYQWQQMYRGRCPSIRRQSAYAFSAYSSIMRWLLKNEPFSAIAWRMTSR